MVELLTKPLTILHVMACLFLILVVLLQPGKGGPLEPHGRRLAGPVGFVLE